MFPVMARGREGRVRREEGGAEGRKERMVPLYKVPVLLVRLVLHIANVLDVWHCRVPEEHLRTQRRIVARPRVGASPVQLTARVPSRRPRRVLPCLGRRARGRSRCNRIGERWEVYQERQSR